MNGIELHQPLPQRGEIWMVDWSPGRGSEQIGRRPSLIIQTDQGNLSATYPNVIVVTISTKGRSIPFHVRIPKSKLNGLREDSWVKCEQIMTISKNRLPGHPLGRITAGEMKQVETGLLLALGFAVSMT